MEKLCGIKNKLLKFVPKEPVALVGHQSPTLSPSGSGTTPRVGRSPTQRVSIVPKEARRMDGIESFSVLEPISPKVSCMGQVKSNKKKGKARKPKEQKESFLLRIFKGSAEDPKQRGKAPTMLVSPSLGTMNKFKSGRGTLSDFDVLER